MRIKLSLTRIQYLQEVPGFPQRVTLRMKLIAQNLSFGSIQNDTIVLTAFLECHVVSLPRVVGEQEVNHQELFTMTEAVNDE